MHVVVQMRGLHGASSCSVVAMFTVCCRVVDMEHAFAICLHVTWTHVLFSTSDPGQQRAGAVGPRGSFVLFPGSTVDTSKSTGSRQLIVANPTVCLAFGW